VNLVMPRQPAKDEEDLLKELERLSPEHSYFQSLQDAVDELWDNLSDNSKRHASYLIQFPSNRSDCDLVAAAGALRVVLDFLRSSPTNSLDHSDRLSCFRILEELQRALVDLLEGSAPAPILRSRKKRSGRRADVSSTLTLKGIIAGLMQSKIRAGMTRAQAANWIVQNMSPKLAERISTKRVTPRMVEEWLDRFGGKHGEQNAARKAYKVWSQNSPTLTKQKFKKITERLGAGIY
jgi:hypothetical protein